MAVCRRPNGGSRGEWWGRLNIGSFLQNMTAERVAELVDALQAFVERAPMRATRVATSASTWAMAGTSESKGEADSTGELTIRSACSRSGEA